MSKDDLGRIVMVVPTYNEAANLPWIVGRLRGRSPARTCSWWTTARPTAPETWPRSWPRRTRR